MKVVHLSRRFVRALSPSAPCAEDLGWVDEVLGADLAQQWRRMPNHDQRHALGVARGVEAQLAGTGYAGDARWLVAALTHDLGKLDARLGVPGRVVATVSAAAAGRDLADAWSERSGFTRRVGLYLRHPDLGADRIRLAGGPEEAATWAAAHHTPDRWADTGIPEPVVMALVAADDD
ncbi:MAG: hypothetical protein ACHQIG_06525 [Acidimicrobiia bacterium]